MNEVIQNNPPILAGWLVLGAAWLLFLIPIPGLGILGWAVNLAAFVISIVVIAKGATGQGVGQLVCSLVVSPIVYFIGLAVFVALLAAMENL